MLNMQKEEYNHEMLKVSDMVMDQAEWSGMALPLF